MPVDIGNAVELAIAGLFGGGLTEAIRAVASRRKARAETTVTLSDSTLKWAKDLQKDADEARAGEQAAWQEVRKTRTEMQEELNQIRSELHKHRQFAELLTYRYRVLISAIMSPNVSRESLMAMASEPGPGGFEQTGG